MTDHLYLLSAAVLFAGICIAFGVPLVRNLLGSCTARGCRVRTRNGLCDHHLQAAIAHDADTSEDDVIDWYEAEKRAEYETAFMRGVEALHAVYVVDLRSLADQHRITTRRASELLWGTRHRTAAESILTTKEHH